MARRVMIDLLQTFFKMFQFLLACEIKCCSQLEQYIIALMRPFHRLSYPFSAFSVSLSIEKPISILFDVTKAGSDRSKVPFKTTGEDQKEEKEEEATAC